MSSSNMLNVMHVPMVHFEQYSLPDAITQVRKKVESRNPADKNAWMGLVYKNNNDQIRAINASYCINRIPEFCGGALLYGVHITNLPMVKTAFALNRWRTEDYGRNHRSRPGCVPEEFWGQGTRSTVDYIRSSFDAGTCELPSINDMLGKKVVTGQEAKRYVFGMLMGSIVTTMLANNWRRIMCADKAGGSMAAMFSAFIKDRRNNRSEIINADDYDRLWSAPLTRYGLLTEYAREVAPARVRVQRSKPFVNANSGNTCHTFIVEADRAPRDRKLAAAANAQAHARYDALKPWTTPQTRDEMNAGVLSRGAALLMHVPIVMPHATAMRWSDNTGLTRVKRSLSATRAENARAAGEATEALPF